jgi:hypothetical protein
LLITPRRWEQLTSQESYRSVQLSLRLSCSPPMPRHLSAASAGGEAVGNLEYLVQSLPQQGIPQEGPTAEQAKFGAVSLQYTAHWVQFPASSYKNARLLLDADRE